MATFHLVYLLVLITSAHTQFTINELARSYSSGNVPVIPIGDTAENDLFALTAWKNGSSKPTKLKAHKTTEETKEEIECLETMYMGPFHDPVTITRNASFLAGREDPSCTWLFFGTAPCVPEVSCSSFDMSPPSPDSGLCESEYLELFDGHQGVERYCGKTGPLRVTAADNLRDLFIKLHMGTRNNRNDSSHKFSCTVACSAKGPNPLPKKYVEKVDPKCRCGTKPNDDRIVGGVTADKNEFPWLVALVQTNTRQPFCGGSILNNRIILTAAHCFKGQYKDINNLEVLVNAHLLDSTPNTLVLPGHPQPKTYDSETLQKLDAGNGSYRFKPEEAYIHPLYVAETNDFDVAAILLSKPIEFTRKTPVPICLPEPGSYGRTYGDKKATVAGWGLPGMNATGTPEVVQKVDVHVFSAPDCKGFYGYRVNHRMMCAGFRQGGTDSCSGDSGGPLVLEDRTAVWYEIGSVSWGDGCAQEGMPGVYFRTTETSQWLHYYSNLNNATWCSVPE